MVSIMYKNSLDPKIKEVDFWTALIDGQPSNGELYTPSSFPTISINDILGKSYPEIGATVMKPFITNIKNGKDEIPFTHKDLLKICQKVYTFDHPLEQFSPKVYTYRMDRGPTASFKDNAAVLMGGLMNHYFTIVGGQLIILTATSGDTGGAIASAFQGYDNIQVVVLFQEKIYDIQRKQMTTHGGNIRPIEVQGPFDQCQDMVRKAFTNLSDKLPLGSANSINIGRLGPQMIYYFDALSRVYEEHGQDEQVIFNVPCGNFGDLTAGLFARRSGMFSKFIAATNESSWFPDFYNNGEIRIQDLKGKDFSSIAMKVAQPSNPRRMFEMYGGLLDKDNRILARPDMKWMKDDIIYTKAMTESQVDEAIKWYYDNAAPTLKGDQRIIEPHGAVSIALLKHIQKNNPEILNNSIVINFETAHPAKFPGKVKSLLGVEPKPLNNLTKFMDREEHYMKMEYNQETFENWLLETFLT